MDNFVKTLIEEVKSQGVFDEFRFNCCLADVDTKPAYQNVRTRVETAVKDFLAKQQWTPETNKVQLRERLRKHLLDSDVLDKGVDHIVDQVVNPKVATIFEPKIESIAYKYLGITPPPPPTNPPPRPPLLPAPPLPAYSGHHMGHLNGANILKVETTTASLLPTDLEQISPDSDRETIKSELKEDSKDDDRPPGVDNDDYFDDDDDDAASPPFEPVGSIKEETNIASLNTSDSFKDIKELLNDSPDAGASQSSQLSQVSSDSRLTITSIDVPQQTSTNNSNMAANMSEEAQMPKFNENSSDENNCGRQLHFDIKQDPITFEGTDRRNSMSDSTNGGANTLSIEQAIMCEVTANLQSDNISTENTTPKLLADQPSESLEAKPGGVTESNFAMFADSATESLNPKESEIIEPQEPLPCASEATPTVPLPIEPEIQPEVTKADVEKPAIDEVASATLTIASDEIKDDEIKSADLTTSPASACSSQQTKKHSHSKDKEKRHHSHHHSRSDGKQRRKSRDRERDKSRSKTSSSKHSSHNSSHSSSSKHRSSSSSKNEKSSTSTTSSRSTHESSSSKRSSSRHESSSHKKHKSSSSSRSDRDRDRSRDSRESHSHSHSHSRSHNGSSSSKKSDRDRDRDRNKSSSNSTTTAITALIQDDHNEEKAKLLKRHSNDSNDEGKPPGSFNKSPAESTHAEGKENKTAENGKEPETNGKSNGSNGNHNQATAELMAATSVIVVSDMLQQSTVNFVDITSAGLAQKLKAEVETPTNEVETGSKLPEQSSEPIAEESKCESPATVVETEIKPEEQPDVPCETTNEVDADKAVEETVKEPFVAAEVKHTADELSEEAVKDHLEESVTEPVKEPVTESEVELSVDKTSAAIDVPSVSESSKGSLTKSDTAVVKEPESETGSATSEDTPDSEVSKPFTHFEDDEDLFKERLLLIEQHIKDRRQLLNVLNEFEDTNCMRRSPAKRRLSSEASSMSKPHSSSSGNSSSSCAGSPAKRARPADAAKTSPTPSEVSVNSKENEELEKHEKDAVTTKRLTQKQCQQQRYSNDDLYKPRPLLSQRSRRRGLDSIL